MFQDLLDKPISVLTLGAKSHNILNGEMMTEVSNCLTSGKWICHVCGVQLPNLMEVDHLKSHSLSGKDALAPICQFCHDRKHLMWAASQKRVRILHAPDLSYEDISQLAWSIILHEKGETGIDRKRLERDLDARQDDAHEAIGHENIESIFESIFTFKDSAGEDATRERLDEMDKHIKFFPSAIFLDGKSVSLWGKGGFKSPQEGWKERSIMAGLPKTTDLVKAGDSLLKKL